MSKGNKFNNLAAKRFNDMSKVDTMSQKDVFEILAKDIKTILGQFTDYRNHTPGASYPTYVANAFANISTVLFFKEYVDEHVKVKKNGKIKTDLEADEVESLRQILAEAYKKSQTNFYSNQAQEYPERNRMLSKTFRKLCPKVYRLSKKLKGLSKPQRRDLTIQVYGDPVFNFKFIHKIINSSSISEKKKLALLKKMYGKKRFVKAAGAAMTVEGNSSDCLAMLYSFIASRKKKKRAKYILAYAEAYKRNKSRYFRIDQDFHDENKDIIKELVRLDLGFKKSIDNLSGAKPKTDGKFNLGKTSDFRPSFRR